MNINRHKRSAFCLTNQSHFHGFKTLKKQQQQKKQKKKIGKHVFQCVMHSIHIRIVGHVPYTITTITRLSFTWYTEVLLTNEYL